MASAMLTVALLGALAALPSIDACRAGEGFAPNTHTCVTCGAGTWSPEGSSECTRCRAGTWSSAAGAVSEDTCIQCPQGTWSSQLGSPTQSSCQACPAGRWGASEGLGASGACTACEAGTWSSESGATTSAVCTRCPAGTWSGVRGASSNQTCIECAPGTWSDETGASAQASCSACRSGTWSSARGADSESTCAACAVGTYQPALGQANESVCIRCSPGNYSLVSGASSCVFCPPGTWSGDFAATECHSCPRGRWASGSGSLREDQCMPCYRSEDCFTATEKSAMVTVDFSNLEVTSLSQASLDELRAAYVAALSEACRVPNASVTDVMGANGTVSLAAGGRMIAWVFPVSGQTANDLAEALYSASVRSALDNATAAVLGDGVAVQITQVSMEPRHFALPTTTSLTTTRATTRASMRATTEATTGATTTGMTPVVSSSTRWQRDIFSGASGAAVDVGVPSGAPRLATLFGGALLTLAVSVSLVV